MSLPILTVEIRFEHDVVNARQRARQLAELVGFEHRDQVRIATTVSELARNTFTYAGQGKIEFQIEGRTAPQVFLVRVTDNGPGIRNLQEILEGRYRSQTGMGLGILGARRLMDQFEIDSAPGRGTKVVVKKLLPENAPVLSASDIGRISADLASKRPQSALEEVEQQNRELMRALEELRRRQEELSRLNQELEDTNRGVVALYAELDEKADHLKRADELKTRFLSNMSHEFRTPLNSTLAIARLLLNRSDGELTPEQEKQVGYIQKSADTLLGLVNDLLDLAKIEAGKVVVRPVHFQCSNLFSALRGMLRPLLVSEHVELIFDSGEDIPELYTDEAKVSQILRNFISNALKFTEQGSIRVSAALSADGKMVTFFVADTGIGIAPEQHDKLFKEFSQLDHQLQKKVRGTGLGLQLSKKLAEVLGGSVGVTSEVGVGSTFTTTIPLKFPEAAEPDAANVEWTSDNGVPVLLVEDDVETIHIYQKYVQNTPFQIVPAQTLRDARILLSRGTPRAVILDVLLKGEDSWRLLSDLKSDQATSSIPVMIVSTVEDQQKAHALGAEAYVVKPIDRSTLLRKLCELTGMTVSRPTLLIVDDDEAALYVLNNYLKDRYSIIEATGGVEALARAAELHPQGILLDLVMPGMNGYDVLNQLADQPATRDIPVIIHTASLLTESDRRRLLEDAVEIVSKDSLSQDAARAQLDAALRKAGLSPQYAPAEMTEALTRN